MDPALLSALSALTGSLIGASASVITSWLTQRGQYALQHRGSDRAKREVLYSDFITEASNRYAEALQAERPNIGDFITLSALANRIRLYGDDATVKAANSVIEILVTTYFATPISIEEFRSPSESTQFDPLLSFSKAARSELLQLR